MADFRALDDNMHKKIRKQLLVKSREADCEIDKTTSWSGELHEDTRFVPFLRRSIRRTDSFDGIEKYKSHFSLAQKNQGKNFTWKDYCNLLQAELWNSDLLDAFNKMSIQPSSTQARSKASNYSTATRSEPSTNVFPENQKQKKRSFLDIDPDVESLSSTDGAKSVHTPSKNVLKKMCTEIRSLAQKTCKTVEKMTTKRYCSVCRDVIGSTTVHKNCSKQCIKKSDYKRPITPSMLKSTNLAKDRLMHFQSPVVTPSGAGVYLTNPRTKSMRRKPLFKV